MKTASQIVQEHSERGAGVEEVIGALADGTADHKFGVQELVSAQTASLMGVLDSLGQIVGGLVNAIGGEVSQGDLGTQLVDSFRVGMAAEMYDLANPEVVEADVVEVG